MGTSYWKTREGNIINIADMETSHIINTINMLERKGFVSIKQKQAYLTLKGPDGDMARDAYNSEQDFVLTAPISPQLDNLRAELKKRREPIKEQSENRVHRCGTFVARPEVLSLDELIEALPVDRED